MDKFSYLSNADVASIEQLYQQYKADENSVDFGWRKFFEGFEFQQKDFESTEPSAFSHKEFNVINLINDYRSRGHLFTKTNPVRQRRRYSPTLDIENYGLSKADLEETFQAGTEIGIGPAKLKDIMANLEQTYCHSIGVEYMYIRIPKVVNWIKNKLNKNKNTPHFSKEEKQQIYKKLNKAVTFESFLHKKFVGQKRFSLEGGEALIPALDYVVEVGSDLGIKEFVLGLAHRGRLNVLANIFKKDFSSIFTEFEGKEYSEDSEFDGDVKYHLGHSNDVITDKGEKVHLTLAPNPSHLEAVGPVVEGLVRSKIDHYLKDEHKICPIIIHGDAAIAAQGVVYETVQMAQLDGYRTGGTIHIVINNQIGFTTNYRDARSSTYCTDVGKVTLSPVFHVNGDDVEAVVHTIKMAMEYRQEFNKDVFIDLLCYRKYGHNEGDEPRFTQPILYNLIAKHPNPKEIYLDQLKAEGVMTQEMSQEMTDEYLGSMQAHFEKSKHIEKTSIASFLDHTWDGLIHKKGDSFDVSPKTGYSKKKLLELSDKITSLPKDKKFFKKIQRLMDARKKMIESGESIDWAMGELLAYATLLDEGNAVRISGQDVERGTFSHRHAVVKVEDSEEEYIPLTTVSKKNTFFNIFNSLLSEYAVLGFDYGYAMTSPHTLTIWEAQFGDFHNGAQIIIDQFIASAEDKWNSMNGLVMLLPHGYEGQGAEHSSARIERFLSLAAEENIQVANCTTPANMFHILRRQLHRNYRKPLIIFTPKSLLRHPKCVSNINDFVNGRFNEVLDDAQANVSKVDTIAFCSGKVYYDLLAKREVKKDDSIAFIRLEQLYPFPKNQIADIVKKYKNAKNLVWMQEEPKNMGPWGYISRTMKEYNLYVIGRKDSASPATGSSQRHAQRHNEILEELFNKKFSYDNK